MTRKELRPVVVTTAHKGVFVGYLRSAAADHSRVTIERARMVVYWSNDVHGVTGLAAKGPTASCRISPAAPSIHLTSVTAIMDATPEAAEAWEKEPWG